MGSFRVWVGVLTVIWPATASARPYVVSTGDSLWRIAQKHRCGVETLQRANRLDGTLIQPGQRLRIPSDCAGTPAAQAPATGPAPAPAGQSVGRPQDGKLVAATRLPASPAAYFIRRPQRAFGTATTVDQVRRAIERVRRKFPRVHPLAIGDLSARAGGHITMHGSHQSGRDVDLGFYFRRPPKGYPAEFAVAREDNLDFQPTFALLSALAETHGRPGGVERIFLSYDTQALFVRLARKARVPAATLDRWFQYPRGPGSDHGIIRDEPGHDEHMHVRFACPPRDAACR